MFAFRFVLAVLSVCISISNSLYLGMNFKFQSLLRSNRHSCRSLSAKFFSQRVDSVITPRTVDYSAWYNDILTASDMVDQSPVRGCMVIKPWGMGVWDEIHFQLNQRIQETGTRNAYFPLFIPKSFLEKEAEHVEGFAKECAVVTHHRLKKGPQGTGLIPDPDSVLEEPLVIRPTSETIIWNMFGKWIHSYRDLPLKINQWANVVRWEMRTRPFLRTTEFLWQEGHTAHASREEALLFARQILAMYAEFCQNVLAIPVIQGEKSFNEKFAGAEATFTIEALMQNGWALQAGTSHFLGQNFAKAFDVFYQTEQNTRDLVWATSWGVSTRLMGAMLMTHSDDKGVVLPPRVAPTQVVIVPIYSGGDDARIDFQCSIIKEWLREGGYRASIDDRKSLRPGAKFFEWERKGVPIRLDIGRRDLTNGQVVLTARNGKKDVIGLTREALIGFIGERLNSIHEQLFMDATVRLDKSVHKVQTYAEMKKCLQNPQAGLFLVPWRDHSENEDFIKNDCKATIRCFPFDQKLSQGMRCFFSDEPATHMALFGRAF